MASWLWCLPVPGYDFYGFIYVCACVRVFVFEISHTFYRKSTGISEVIDVLGSCILEMWVIAEQSDISIIRLANLFSSEVL